MERNEIFAKLNTIFQDVLDEDDVTLGEDTTADDVEEWDSLNHIQIIVAIEKNYGIKFTAMEVDGFNSVGQMVDAIIAKAG